MYILVQVKLLVVVLVVVPVVIVVIVVVENEQGSVVVPKCFPWILSWDLNCETHQDQILEGVEKVAEPQCHLTCTSQNGCENFHEVDET